MSASTRFSIAVRVLRQAPSAELNESPERRVVDRISNSGYRRSHKRDSGHGVPAFQRALFSTVPWSAIYCYVSGGTYVFDERLHDAQRRSFTVHS